MHTQRTTRTATITLHPDDTIWITSHPGAVETREDALDNMCVLEELSYGRSVLIGLDMSAVKTVNLDARDIYTGVSGVEMAALAIVVGSLMSQVLGMFYVSLNQSSMPMRVFRSRQRAEQWLRHLQRRQQAA